MRRNTCLFLPVLFALILLVVALALAACGEATTTTTRAVTTTQAVTTTTQAPTTTTTAAPTTKRDTSTLAKALIGHWVVDGTGTELYFGSTDFTRVNSDRRVLTGTWSLLQSEAASRRIVLGLDYGSEWPAEQYYLVFSPDFSTMEEEGVLFRYLDNKTKPPK